MSKIVIDIDVLSGQCHNENNDICRFRHTCENNQGFFCRAFDKRLTNAACEECYESQRKVEEIIDNLSPGCEMYETMSHADYAHYIKPIIELLGGE